MVEPLGFPGGLDVGCLNENGSKGTSKVFVLSSYKDWAPLAEMGKAVKAEGFAGRIQSLVLDRLSLRYRFDLQIEILRREVYL